MGSADAATPARPPTIDTGGGAYLAGPVEVSSGTIVGRDQLVAGDLVQGDQYQERVALPSRKPTQPALASAQVLDATLSHVCSISLDFREGDR
jgi:hypothetical protein